MSTLAHQPDIPTPSNEEQFELPRKENFPFVPKLKVTQARKMIVVM